MYVCFVNTKYYEKTTFTISDSSGAFYYWV